VYGVIRACPSFRAWRATSITRAHSAAADRSLDRAVLEDEHLAAGMPRIGALRTDDRAQGHRLTLAFGRRGAGEEAVSHQPSAFSPPDQPVNIALYSTTSAVARGRTSPQASLALSPEK
jgi:hypothetical protein